MARKESDRAGKDHRLTLSDADVITKRVYGRRMFLRGVGATLVGAGAIAASWKSAKAAGDGKDPSGDVKDQGKKGADLRSLQDGGY